MASDTLLVDGLAVEIDGRTSPILQAIDLAVACGTIMGLIGESGSGKTTLARAILGILPEHFRITGGRIVVQGQALTGPASPKRNVAIAYVPQDPSTALDPLFTIGAQIADVLRARRRDLGTARQRRECALEHLRSVRLADAERLLQRHPHEVSGGQRQRLMIALALMCRPALIVADEPTTALDLTTQAQILRLIRRLADQHGVAVVLTTHDPGVAHEVCDRLSVMHQGRIVETEAAGTLLRTPRHPYTRRLLAARQPAKKPEPRGRQENAA